MNRNLATALAMLAVTSVVCLSPAHAQTIPPACQQLVTAWKACGTAYVRLAELKDPAQAVQAKQQLESSLTNITSQMRAAVRQAGAQAVAERCATPEAKGQMVQSIAAVITMLGFGGGMTEECNEAYSAIR